MFIVTLLQRTLYKWKLCLQLITSENILKDSLSTQRKLPCFVYGEISSLQLTQ